MGDFAGALMASITVHSNNIENIAIGSLNVKWSARGDRILRYYVDVGHKKLNLHKEISAPELFILQSKMDALMAGWDENILFLSLDRMSWPVMAWQRN